MKGMKKSISLFLCFFLMIGYTTPIFAGENRGEDISDFKNDTEAVQQEDVTLKNEEQKEENNADIKGEKENKEVTKEKSGEEEKNVTKEKSVKSTADVSQSAEVIIKYWYDDDKAGASSINMPGEQGYFDKGHLNLDTSKKIIKFEIEKFAGLNYSNEMCEVSDFSNVEISFQNAMGVFVVEHSGNIFSIPVDYLNQNRDSYDNLRLVDTKSFSGFTMSAAIDVGEESSKSVDYTKYAGTYKDGKGNKIVINNDGRAVIDGTQADNNHIDLEFLIKDNELSLTGLKIYTYTDNILFDFDDINNTLSYVKITSNGGVGKYVPQFVYDSQNTPLRKARSIEVSSLNRDFYTISEAVSAANSGDTVLIPDETYSETIAIDKNITLKGMGEGPSKVMGRALISESVTLDNVDFEYTSTDRTDRGVIVISGNDDLTVIIKNCGLTQNAGNKGLDTILVDEAKGITLNIDNCKIKGIGNGSQAITFKADHSALNLNKCSVTADDTSSYGIAVAKGYNTINIKNSDISSEKYHAVRLSDTNNTLTVDNSNIKGYGAVSLSAGNGSGKLAAKNAVITIKNGSVLTGIENPDEYDFAVICSEFNSEEGDSEAADNVKLTISDSTVKAVDSDTQDEGKEHLIMLKGKNNEVYISNSSMLAGEGKYIIVSGSIRDMNSLKLSGNYWGSESPDFAGKIEIANAGNIDVGGYYTDENLKISSADINSIKLNKNKLNLKEGKSEKLEYTVDANQDADYQVTFESSDESVAAVDGTGNVTAVKEGSAKITACAVNNLDSTNNKYASCEVNVIKDDGKLVPQISGSVLYANGSDIEIRKKAGSDSGVSVYYSNGSESITYDRDNLTVYGDDKNHSVKKASVTMYSGTVSKIVGLNATGNNADVNINILGGKVSSELRGAWLQYGDKDRGPLSVGNINIKVSGGQIGSVYGIQGQGENKEITAKSVNVDVRYAEVLTNGQYGIYNGGIVKGNLVMNYFNCAMKPTNTTKIYGIYNITNHNNASQSVGGNLSVNINNCTGMENAEIYGASDYADINDMTVNVTNTDVNKIYGGVRYVNVKNNSVINVVNTKSSMMNVKGECILANGEYNFFKSGSLNLKGNITFGGYVYGGGQGGSLDYYNEMKEEGGKVYFVTSSGSKDEISKIGNFDNINIDIDGPTFKNLVLFGSGGYTSVGNIKGTVRNANFDMGVNIGSQNGYTKKVDVDFTDNVYCSEDIAFLWRGFYDDIDFDMSRTCNVKTLYVGPAPSPSGEAVIRNSVNVNIEAGANVYEPILGPSIDRTKNVNINAEGIVFSLKDMPLNASENKTVYEINKENVWKLYTGLKIDEGVSLNSKGKVYIDEEVDLDGILTASKDVVSIEESDANLKTIFDISGDGIVMIKKADLTGINKDGLELNDMGTLPNMSVSTATYNGSVFGLNESELPKGYSVKYSNKSSVNPKDYSLDIMKFRDVGKHNVYYMLINENGVRAFKVSRVDILSDIEEVSLSGGKVTYQYDIYTGDVTVKGVKGSFTSKVELPESVKVESVGSKKITKIGREAFYKCPTLSGVVLPSTVREIEDYAFFDCTKLSGIYIPSSVKVIGENVFGTKSSGFTIYSTKGSYAESYAKDNGYKFIECTKPVITTNVVSSTYYKNQAVKALSVKASGGDIKYQWYSNTKNSVSGAKAIKGAVTASYKPSAKKEGTTYYFVKVQNYLGNINSKIAKISVKPNIASAKISGIKTAVYTGKKIGQKPVIKIGKKTLKVNKDYKLSYQNNIKAGKAYVTISGINTYAGSIKKGFIIKPKKGAISKASSKSKSITLTIKSQKSSGVTKYHVAYKIKDSNKYYKYVTTKNLKYTIKKLKKNKIYSLRVRGRIDVGSKVYYGEWSKIKNVKVK
ncbi:leucine-rich repeat protein [uncultured Anaerofustis sp.]|uniref:leucine-rich repeat protein n=1 Tax=uncultured Anaerofustis sp. TaxID=904996 RepID=UPI0025FAF530|nr:leucine-rich repeat protein [uncultured Anaerofustis sp.]